MEHHRRLWTKFFILILGLAVFGLLANVTDAQAKKRKLRFLATTGFSGPLVAMGRVMTGV